MALDREGLQISDLNSQLKLSIPSHLLQPSVTKGLLCPWHFPVLIHHFCLKNHFHACLLINCVNTTKVGINFHIFGTPGQESRDLQRGQALRGGEERVDWRNLESQLQIGLWKGGQRAFVAHAYYTHFTGACNRQAHTHLCI